MVSLIVSINGKLEKMLFSNISTFSKDVSYKVFVKGADRMLSAIDKPISESMVLAVLLRLNISAPKRKGRLAPNISSRYNHGELTF